jgi:hypothetical protein
MKALVVGRPQFQVPPEQAPMLVQGAIEWYERYKENFIAFGTFVGGGGFGVVDVPDTDALNKMVAEMPFAMFSDMSVDVYVPGADGFHQFLDALQTMMAGAPA